MTLITRKRNHADSLEKDEARDVTLGTGFLTQKTKGEEEWHGHKHIVAILFIICNLSLHS